MDREVSFELSQAHQTEVLSANDDAEDAVLRAEMAAENALWRKLLACKEGVAVAYGGAAPSEHLTRQDIDSTI